MFGGCPSIITGKHKEETKAYYFENREQPGTNINFFAGNAPCGNGSQENTLKNYETRTWYCCTSYRRYG